MGTSSGTRDSAWDSSMRHGVPGLGRFKLCVRSQRGMRSGGLARGRTLRPGPASTIRGAHRTQAGAPTAPVSMRSSSAILGILDQSLQGDGIVVSCQSDNSVNAASVDSTTSPHAGETPRGALEREETTDSPEPLASGHAHPADPQWMSPCLLRARRTATFPRNRWLCTTGAGWLLAGPSWRRCADVNLLHAGGGPSDRVTPSGQHRCQRATSGAGEANPQVCDLRLCWWAIQDLNL